MVGSCFYDYDEILFICMSVNLGLPTYNQMILCLDSPNRRIQLMFFPEQFEHFIVGQKNT